MVKQLRIDFARYLLRLSSWFLSLTLFAFGIIPQALSDEERTIGFIGDSLALGLFVKPLPEDGSSTYVAKRDFVLNASRREFSSTTRWIFANAAEIWLPMMEVPALAWPYLLGKSLGYDDKNILVAASQWSGTDHGVHLVSRIFERTNDRIPDKLVVFFSLDDLCKNLLEEVPNGEQYAANLKTMIRYLIKNGKTSPLGSDIYFVANLGMVQTRQSSEILAKKVHFAGKELSCKEAGNHRTSFINIGTALGKSPNLAMMCPTMLEMNIDRVSDQLSVLANRIRSFRTVTSKFVAEESQRLIQQGQPAADKRFRFHFISATDSIVFGEKDIGYDCLHLSEEGQTKVSQVLETSIKQL